MPDSHPHLTMTYKRSRVIGMQLAAANVDLRTCKDRQ